MQKLIHIFLGLVVLCFTVQAYPEDTNHAATNQVMGSVASTNGVPKYTDAELQAGARAVWFKLKLLAAFVLVSALVVAGFAIYGAHHAFGMKAVIPIVLLIGAGFLALLMFLGEAF